MSLAFPQVEAQRLTDGAQALNQALLGIRCALEQLEQARATPPRLDERARQAWVAAVEARTRDLSQAADVVEHARNVLLRCGHDLPELEKRHHGASGAERDELVRDAVALLAMSADQFIKMSQRVRFAGVPESAPAAVRDDGSVEPLDEAHTLVGGMVLVEGRDY